MDFGPSVWSAATVLLFVLDPFGNLPVVMSILEKYTNQQRLRIIARELLIALAVLLAFLFAGEAILEFLGLERESVTIAGGLVLGIIGIRMIFPRADGVMGTQPSDDPFIVPLAIPLIAGPSAMATVILMAKDAPERMGHWTLAVLIAWGISAVVLLAAPALYRVLRQRGLHAIERLMGMLLIMISVQMLTSGLSNALGF